MMADFEKLAHDARLAAQKWSEDWRYEFEERAAIKEIDGGIPRARATFEAFCEIRKRKQEWEAKGQ